MENENKQFNMCAASTRRTRALNKNDIHTALTTHSLRIVLSALQRARACSANIQQQ